MWSVASTEDEADYELTKKHLHLPSRKKIKLKSPRFLAALSENGVPLCELEEPDIDNHYHKAGGNWVLAEREWGVADQVRRDKLDLVVGHRDAAIKAAGEDTVKLGTDAPPAHELLDRGALVALDKEHTARVLQKRAKKQAFEASQQEFFAARHRETVETAHKKHSRAQSFLKASAEEQARYFEEQGERFAVKQQRAKDGFARWEEGKEEQRQQMQRRDAEAADRNSSIEEQRSFDLMNRSVEFSQRVERGQKRGDAILLTRKQILLDEKQVFETRTGNRAKLSSSELNAARKAQRKAADAEGEHIFISE